MIRLGCVFVTCVVLTGCGPTGPVDIEDREAYERALADVEAVGEQLVSLRGQVEGTDVQVSVPQLLGCGGIDVDYMRHFSTGGSFVLPLQADPVEAERVLAAAGDELWTRKREARRPEWSTTTKSGIEVEVILTVNRRKLAGQTLNVASFGVDTPCLTFASGELAEQAEDELDERFRAEEQ